METSKTPPGGGIYTFPSPEEGKAGEVEEEMGSVAEGREGEKKPPLREDEEENEKRPEEGEGVEEAPVSPPAGRLDEVREESGQEGDGEGEEGLSGGEGNSRPAELVEGRDPDEGSPQGVLPTVHLPSPPPAGIRSFRLRTGRRKTYMGAASLKGLVLGYRLGTV
jgi:hypothetical protein